MKALIKKVVPAKLLIGIQRIYNEHLGYYSKAYSQEGEDMILKRFFEGKQKGYYVDVGAHHPKRFSNTYYFYKKGWSGINIDAAPGSMKLFDRFRPRDINIEKPVYYEKKTLIYYIFNDQALNSFSKEISEFRDQEDDGFFIVKTVEIETERLDELLKSNLPADQKIDFLSIDVEGLDFDVLKSLDFAKYRPTLILIEMLDNDFEAATQSEVTKFLAEKKYSIYGKTCNTVFFVDFDYYQQA